MTVRAIVDEQEVTRRVRVIFTRGHRTEDVWGIQCADSGEVAKAVRRARRVIRQLSPAKVLALGPEAIGR